MRLGVTTMRVRLLILLALFPCPSWAVTWYATSPSVNINTSSLWVPTSTGTCTGSGTPLIWGSQANGDVFNANGCTALAVNVDPGSSGTVQVTLTNDVTNGGGFTCATAIGPATIHANVTATKATGMATTGSSGSGCNVSGNLQGGSTASAADGVSDAHTSGASAITYTGTITGGSTGGNNFGLIATNSGTVHVVGSVIAGTGSTGGISATNTPTTITGNCIGSDTASTTVGCVGGTGGTNGIVVTGGLVNGKIGQAAIGNVHLSATATNYVVIPENSSFVVTNCLTAAQVAAGSCTNAAILPADPGVANVLTGTNYGPFTGTYTPSGGGGGISVFGSW